MLYPLSHERFAPMRNIVGQSPTLDQPRASRQTEAPHTACGDFVRALQLRTVDIRQVADDVAELPDDEVRPAHHRRWPSDSLLYTAVQETVS